MTKKQITQYYDLFLEEVQEGASEKTKNACNKMEEWLDEYVSHVAEDMFNQAFQYGYGQGLKEAKRSSNRVDDIAEGKLLVITDKDFRLGEDIIKYSTEDEILELRRICKNIGRRKREFIRGGVQRQQNKDNQNAFPCGGAFFLYFLSTPARSVIEAERRHKKGFGTEYKTAA